MDFARSQNFKLTDKSGRSVDPSELQGKVVALYFSAHWCPPCRGFTPKLKEFHEAVKAKGLPFEIIFVSSDKSAAEQASYFNNDHGNWLMLDLAQKDQASGPFNIKGIPTLIVIDAAGKAVAPDARDDVSSSTNPEQTFANWQKLCADWRATAGASVGGAPAATDAAAMRAARLARLGGGPAPAPAPPAPAPAPAPAVDPTPAPAPEAAQAPAPGPDPQAIQQITGMGFTEDQAKHALEAANGNVETAVALLLEQ